MFVAGLYRHLQARLRSNAESVAFYGGIEKEGKIITQRFKELLRHHSRILTKQWQFGKVKVRAWCFASVTCTGPSWGFSLCSWCMLLRASVLSPALEMLMS